MQPGRHRMSRRTPWIAALVALMAWGTANGQRLVDLVDTAQYGWVVQPPGVFLGRAVSGVGDYDADGFSDVVVSDPLGVGLNGRVYGVFGRSTLSLGIERANIVRAGMENSGFGYALAASGDADWNGESNFLVGEPGRSFIAEDYGFSAGVLGFGARPGEITGTSVAGVGDVDGDGRDDIAYVVLSEGAEPTRVVVVYGAAPPTRGRSYFIGGFPDSVPDTPDRALQVAGVGDVNGDGVPDIAIASPNSRRGVPSDTGTGLGWIVLGRSDGVTESVDLASSPRVIEIYVNSAQLGESLGAIGDWNGDGLNDVAFGFVPGNPDFLGDQGDADLLLVLGSRALQDVSFDAFGDTPAGVTRVNWSFGFVTSSISGVGDVDADGYADFIVGWDRFTFAEGFRQGTGLACVVRGRREAPMRINGSADPSTTCFVGPEGSRAGASVAAAGDFNADGFPEFIIGAPNAVNASGVGSSGAAYIIDSRRVADRAGWGSPPASSLYQAALAAKTCRDEPGLGIGSIGNQQDWSSPSSRFWADLCRADAVAPAPGPGRINVRVNRSRPALLALPANSFARVYWQLNWSMPQPARTPAAMIAVSYTAAEIAGIDESTLRLYRLDGPSWQPVAGSRLDAGRNRLFALVPTSAAPQFYAVRGEPVPQANLAVSVDLPLAVRNGDILPATWRFENLSPDTASTATLVGYVEGVDDEPQHWTCRASRPALCPQINASNFPGRRFSFDIRLAAEEFMELSMRAPVDTEEPTLGVLGEIAPLAGQPEDPSEENNLLFQTVMVQAVGPLPGQTIFGDGFE